MFSLRRAVLVALLLVLPTSGCALVSVSRGQELRVGRRHASEMDRKLDLVRDPAVAGPVRAVGHQMASASSRPNLPWEFKVVDDGSLNALALPGGFVYLNRGVLVAADSMYEVVGVVAHEIAHVTARHGAKRIEHARGANALGTAGVILTDVLLEGETEETVQTGLVIGGKVGAALYFSDYSRDQEAAADSLAVGYMVENGWDPRGLTRFFEKLKKEKGDTGGGLLDSHPMTSDRIEAVRRIIGRLEEGRLDSLRRTSPEFEALQEALKERGAW